MHEPAGRAAAAQYIDRGRTNSRRRTAARLLAGSSYELAQAIAKPEPTASETEALILTAIDALIDETTRHGTEWHHHRAIELMHHLDWAWRKAQQINNGPKDPT